MSATNNNRIANEAEGAHSLQGLVMALAETKEALRKAILSKGRVKAECTDYDPAGSTYEVDWLPEVKEWAKRPNTKLCEGSGK